MEALVTSKDMDSFRVRFDERETGLIWQSLMFHMGYRCSHCMAGTDALPAFTENRKAYAKRIVTPLKDRRERVYVQAGTRAESVAAENSNKEAWPVQGVVRSTPK